ncbi:GH36-type glycosyl hydrolase domain-containing protein [Pseudomonas abieticivorans]|uniref:GH36-type glycosyl hydrolase domain-containing protein n=1 Tax=Pseudomonas abieticivorans TaxID=2931382 RepID=UPI0020BFFE7D|nr:glucoamylase family protein [Pseudomonas sp. PIA16]
MDSFWTRPLAAISHFATRRPAWLPTARKFEYEPLLRAELFSADQMAQHGVQLAQQQRLSALSAKDSLLGRLTENQGILDRSCAALRIAQLSTRRATPAAEWLLDNYFLIEEHIRTARTHLPKGYSRQLPRLANGPSAGLPRVYDIALETIAHGDGRVDAQSLSRFVMHYQSITPLALGELWAIPIMLRLALIENLRRVASRVMANWEDRNLADDWADRLIGTAEKDVKNVVLAVADMARSGPPLSTSFIAELARRLQGQSAALVLPLAWIEQALSETGLNIERQVQLDAQQQAADQVSIGNSIGSLRLLTAVDWREFVEAMSPVEHTLRTDPAGVYAQMDFATRDHYRHVIEHLARHCKHTEGVVARTAIELAAGVASPSPHVGYYLVGAGLLALERQLAAGVSLADRWKRLLQRSPLDFYLCPALLITALLAWPFIADAERHMASAASVLLLGVAAVLATSRLAIGLVNWLVTLTVAPSVLPRLDYSKGIPAAARTLVVIPTLIAGSADIEELVDGLEVRFLANRDPQLFFALLTDFMDAPSEHQPDDDALLGLARERIDTLNARYPDGGLDRFFLLHRPRRWNRQQQQWMGHERKRGKLAELNALLRGQGLDRFSLIVGDITPLASVRYVITLDTDTLLPRDVAGQCIGAMMHPMNQPQFDDSSGRIRSGHAILQPRVGISLPSATRSPYAQLYGSDAGVDPYTRAVSDVYQDLFEQGSFIGKGIYQVDAFERALAGQLPENRILSHDLIEGSYARAGLLSDVQVYEQYPARYSADVKRRHRWIRGDWQLLPWVLPWAPTASGRWARNGLGDLARWKILDNLRRSLEPAALLVMLAWGWLYSAHPLGWTLALLGMCVLQPLLAMLLDLLKKSPEVPLAQHVGMALAVGAQQLSRTALGLAWLPHEAYYSLDAIARTLWRMAFSKHQLLQWQPSREAERASTNRLPGLFRQMAAGPLLAVVLAALLWPDAPALACAAPFLLAWLAGPALAGWLSRQRLRDHFAPSAQERQFLRVLSRKTWAFFDHHVNPQNNWLPPDNVQEIPQLTVAHRTSPTNIGMALLAHLAAHDFGYLSASRLLQRLALSLETLVQLPRHRRHFYNWYDTQTLQPLLPLYVSTVDSGNLAGLLLTLRPGLLGLADSPLAAPRQRSGLLDTLDTLLQALHAAHLDTHAAQALRDAVHTASQPGELAALLAHLEPLALPADTEAAFWSQALNAHCADLRAELDDYALPAALGPGHLKAATWRQLAALDTDRWAPEHHARVTSVRQLAATRLACAAHLAEQCAQLADMDFSLLYDSQRDLFAIGYNASDNRLDSGYYDLLASEVRLTNFVTIAQGQVPQQAWFTLGRLLSNTGGVPVLLSWTGSMFEYLMPMLVMPNYEGTLLDQTCRGAVALQIDYGQQLGIPWGISESGYNTMDAHFNYQYRAFGVPGLGLKRGLGEDLVVAPYASALALMVDPQAACRNLQRLASQGCAGRFGLYEAVDFTEARLPRGQRYAVVQSFMAHHQGMSLLALTSLLLDQPMQRRFESDPQFQATALLLQERVPKTAAHFLHASQAPAVDEAARQQESHLRVFADPGRKRPAIQLLSNGRYHVMVSSGGGGYSRHNDTAVTRWQEDITCDNWGSFCYLRDVATGTFWSAAHQPTRHEPDSHEAIFSDARAEFRVRTQDFDSHMEIVISPEDDIELRRLHLTNRGRTRRTLELTSYAEVVLAPAISDAMHPAFSKLFVQTELLPELQAIICTRRPRASNEAVPWMCHLLAAHGVDIQAISYETDRARFIGRGRTLAAPAALDAAVERLSGSAGAVLDPIVAIRCRISLEPGQTATLDLVTGIASQREGCVQLIQKYRDRHLADRVFDLAWTHSQVLLRQLNASLAEARLYEQMASSILYANASLRADNGVLKANRRNQSSLWGQAISGDLPIVLLQITTQENIELVQQLVKAHAYWRQKGLVVDLVIWNEDQAGYRQQLQDLIMGLVTSGSEAALIDRPGGIFVRPAQQLSQDDRTLMLSVARLVLSEGHGSLAEQVHRRRAVPPFTPLVPSRELPAPPREPVLLPTVPGLQLENQYGGFSADGREYVMTLRPGQSTPAPWANVLANRQFGSVISEAGGAYTWAENAHEYRLTPWHNDPVSDSSGEAIYIRDEETGHFWSPTPLPCPGSGSYRTRHGFGYSVFEHSEHGIDSELWVFVALDAPIKFTQLKLHNRSGRPRKLSVTSYVEWVLADLRGKSAMHVVTEADPFSGALFARNAYSIEFGERVAFLDGDAQERSFSGDRTEFLGRNGSLKAPLAMTQTRLSGRSGGGLDPCAALQNQITLEDGQRQEVVFRLGAGKDANEATRWVQQFRGTRAAGVELDAVRAYWQRLLGVIQVQTPEPSLDVMVNGWLMYQVIACRFLGRSGYYQSGGAIGFRDQLQDSMAMLHADPAAVRRHLVLCAGHQYLEGDVQHWWQPPLDRGVRTGCSDDFLWLALATSRYVQVTGDLSVLDEPAGYLEGRPLAAGEESYYDLPGHSPVTETLYQHCVRALEHSLARGVHGLPLMGCGDWNDGMNRVGQHGLGESVWLGFFGYEVLQQFARLAQVHGDSAVALRCAQQATRLQSALEQQAWDGNWYRRAWFDDGQLLGSAGNGECQIDSISQSWAVLSGAAAPARQRCAMQSVNTHLVRRDLHAILLLDPPFDKGTLDPGYIKGYVPGVRENGGQYTHAAVWASMAFARLGDSARAWELTQLINPANLPANRMATYKVEPYVMAADVYGAAPHAGRGGWTWYTGSAGWMYRLIVESLLGLTRNAATLRLEPLLPAGWPGFTLHYRQGNATYHIQVQAAATSLLTLDGRQLPGGELELVDDGLEHWVQALCLQPSLKEYPEVAALPH